MAFDHVIINEPLDRKVEIIHKKFSEGCDTKVGQKFSLGGCCPVKYISSRAYDMIVNSGILSEIDDDIKQRFLSREMTGQELNAILRTNKRLTTFGLTFDHTIPVEVAYKWLINDKSRTSKEALETLFKDEVLSICLITKYENDMLNAAGLRQKMPDSWDGNVSLANMFLRYDIVGITPLELAK